MNLIEKLSRRCMFDVEATSFIDVSEELGYEEPIYVIELEGDQNLGPEDNPNDALTINLNAAYDAGAGLFTHATAKVTSVLGQNEYAIHELIVNLNDGNDTLTITAGESFTGFIKQQQAAAQATPSITLRTGGFSADDADTVNLTVDSHNGTVTYADTTTAQVPWASVIMGHDFDTFNGTNAGVSVAMLGTVAQSDQRSLMNLSFTVDNAFTQPAAYFDNGKIIVGSDVNYGIWQEWMLFSNSNGVLNGTITPNGTKWKDHDGVISIFPRSPYPNPPLPSWRPAPAVKFSPIKIDDVLAGDDVLAEIAA